jgi:hypothetical protein
MVAIIGFPAPLSTIATKEAAETGCAGHYPWASGLAATGPIARLR